MIPLLAIIIGLLIGLFLNVNLPNVVYPYLALLILCTLDSLIGGFKSRYAREYSAGLFITGWLGNCIAAVLMNALGDALGVNLALPVQILLGMRIFRNIARLRRIWLSRIERRQRSIRIWMEKSGKDAEELPIEQLSGEASEKMLRAEALRSKAKSLRLEADSLLNEADAIAEQEAMDALYRAEAKADEDEEPDEEKTADEAAETPEAKTKDKAEEQTEKTETGAGASGEEEQK